MYLLNWQAVALIKWNKDPYFTTRKLKENRVSLMSLMYLNLPIMIIVYWTHKWWSRYSKSIQVIMPLHCIGPFSFVRYRALRVYSCGIGSGATVPANYPPPQACDMNNQIARIIACAVQWPFVTFLQESGNLNNTYSVFFQGRAVGGGHVISCTSQRSVITLHLEMFVCLFVFLFVCCFFFTLDE